jgi:hypothetical protein
MNAFAAFSSPMGPIHFATPASSSALLRIPFFSKPKSGQKSPRSITPKNSPTRTEKSAPVYTQCASVSPPSYREATADAQELEDADVESDILDMYFLHDREERITEARSKVGCRRGTSSAGVRTASGWRGKTARWGWR